ncbi:hypothetical protein Slin14017_G034570 [Septoria linicola]|nr:hypothetical protein Slin14017_G034570 [Septoria linicola]
MSTSQDPSLETTTQDGKAADTSAQAAVQPGKESRTAKVKRAGGFSIWSIVNGFGGMHAEAPPGENKAKSKSVEKFERKERAREAKNQAKLER